MIYASADLYIASVTGTIAKIDAIDAIIDALLAVAAKGASTGNISEYSLNDGQTQIRTAYKDMGQVEASIRAFERLRTLYVNRIQGRRVRLMDIKNFRQ